MMTPRESFEEIARLLEQAMAPDCSPRDALLTFIPAAHTHAVIQASCLRRREGLAELAAHQFTGGTVQ